MKPNNLLVHESGALKLADFGLASFWESGTGEWEEYTRAVFARWYRAPELVGRQKVRAEGGFVGGWDGIRGVDAEETVLRGKFGYRSVDEDIPRFRDADGGGVGRCGRCGLDEFSEEKKMDLRKIFGVEVGGKSGVGGSRAARTWKRLICWNSF